MTQLFTSTGFCEKDLALSNASSALKMSQLPPFLRVLLTTDGTVTKSLESYFWEPVAVVNISQHPQVLDTGLPLIDKVSGVVSMGFETLDTFFSSVLQNSSGILSGWFSTGRRLVGLFRWHLDNVAVF